MTIMLSHRLLPPFLALISSILPNYCVSAISKDLSSSKLYAESTFSPAVATWYGDPNGAGSVGGACGYGIDVARPPFSAMISAGNANIFQSGKGCGACYEVKCNQNPACSGNPITITITDECPCDPGNVHFDLSGVAFGAMAKPGQAELLRAAGTFSIGYRRVPCNYPSTNLAFNIDPGSNPQYFACVIKYVKGDGDLSSVELQIVDSNDDVWLPMQQSWGATWKIDLPFGAKAPFSVRITTLQNKQTIVAKHVIPVDWTPGKSYAALVNFD